MRNMTIAQTTVPYLDALETEEFYNGASRRTLTLTCLPDAIGLDALNALLSEQALADITLADTDTGIANHYEGYVLKLECGLRSEQLSPETPEAPAVYGPRLVLKLGRRTYLEQALRSLGL